MVVLGSWYHKKINGVKKNNHGTHSTLFAVAKVSFKLDFLNQNPFTTSFNELIQHHANIIEGKTTNIEAEELSGMPRAKLQADKRRRGMLEPRIFNLSSNLI